MAIYWDAKCRPFLAHCDDAGDDGLNLTIRPQMVTHDDGNPLNSQLQKDQRSFMWEGYTTTDQDRRDASINTQTKQRWQSEKLVIIKNGINRK